MGSKIFKCQHLLILLFKLWISCEAFRDQQQYSLHGHTNARCVDIPQNLSLCHNIGYTRMRLPNLLDQETLDEVSQQSAFWLPLLASRCNPNTRLFLCSLFSPVCLDQPVYPCRSLCESVRDDCEPRMARFGFPWPGMFACNQFPVDNQLCIGQINIEDNVDNFKGAGEGIDDITKSGSFGFNEADLKSGKHNLHDKSFKKGQNKNKHKASLENGKDNHLKNNTKEPLKKNEVIKTLELICKADFAARIKPTGIFSMEATRESRITSKKVVFYKSDEAVLRTAKLHPSDFGPSPHHRYYFYVDDALLQKLSQRNFHPSFADERNQTNNVSKHVRLPGSKAADDTNHAYKIHKNDQLLVSGNKTVASGKHNGRLSLSLIMHVDEGRRFVKRIIKMFKEDVDFCREAEAMKDPIDGDRRMKHFVDSGERRQKDFSAKNGHENGNKKHNKKKNNHRDHKNVSRNKKNKSNPNETSDKVKGQVVFPKHNKQGLPSRVESATTKIRRIPHGKQSPKNRDAHEATKIILE